MPAGEIEDTVRGMLGASQTWRGATELESVDAEHVATVWKSLGESSRDTLLPWLIERVTLNRHSGAVAVRLRPGCVQRLVGDIETRGAGCGDTQTNTVDFGDRAE